MSDFKSENYNALDFEKNFFYNSDSVLKQNASDFEFDFFGMSDFIKTWIQKITLPSFTPRTRDFLLFSCFSRNNDLETKFFTRQILSWKKYIA